VKESAYAIVVIGTSQGGLDALREIVRALPNDYEIPVAVVQHRHPDSDAMLARVLQEYTQLAVCEVDDKQPIEPRHVFVAPANYHLLVEQGHFSLSVDAPVRYSRPSIDVTLLSASDAYAHRAVGVVLTGANADGSRGLRQMVDRGGLGVVQDPAGAEAPAMPRAALRAVPTARVFALDRIGPFLSTLQSMTATAPDAERGGSAA
jgi:two-component system chemotaxis response regulator CheB